MSERLEGNRALLAQPRYALWHGVDAPPPELRTLRAGPLTVALDGVDLRYVRVGRLELVRRVYAAVRDRNWNTIDGVASEIAVDDRGDSFDVRFSVRHQKGDLDFAWDGLISGSVDGRITFALDGVAGRDMLYNRIGFCVLHPFRETAGRPYRARTPDGEVTGELPLLVGEQRFENGLYGPLFPSFDHLEIELAAGATVELDFEGDLWEAEDQRNWTDASFKTYCTPLALGFPHELTEGDRIHQRVTISAAGVALEVSREEDERVILTLGEPLGRTLPAIGLSEASDGAPPTDRELALLRALDLDHLRIEVHLETPRWENRLRGALAGREPLGWPAEVALFLHGGHERELERLSSLLEKVPIARILVALAGAQTATPQETTPPELVDLVRRRLGRGPVAGGTDMYFCELNRTRPRVEAMDAIFYTITPQIHAFDDVSLVETLEAQAETVLTATAFADGKPVVVSPVTLRRRSNVHATADETGPAERTLPDPVDPRQLSLLGAAWTTGSAKYLGEAGAASVTYFETTGWRGVLERESGSPEPELFPSRPGEVFPLYHVLRDLGELKGAELLKCETTDPLAAVGLAVRHGSGTSLLVANVTPDHRELRLEGLERPAEARRLNERTAGQAAASPDEFRRARARLEDVSTLELAPFETLRIDL